MPPVVRINGFTLVELVIAVAILAIGAAFAVPAFGDLVASQRVGAAANEVVAGVHHARMRAIAQRERVVLCPSQDGSSCSDGDDWARAIVFTDASRDGERDEDEVVLRQWNLAGTGVGIAPVEGDTPSRITLGATGLVLPNPNGTMTRLVACAPRLANRRNVVELNSGGARTYREASDAGCP